jgi:hypothetical protein
MKRLYKEPIFVLSALFYRKHIQMPKITVYLSEELESTVRLMAKKERRSLTVIVDMLLTQALKERARKKKNAEGQGDGRTD